MKSATPQKFNSSTIAGYKKISILLLGMFLLLLSCNSKKENKIILFEALEGKQTGLDFVNKLTATPDFNMFK